MRHSKGSYKTVVYTDTGLPQEIRKISNKQPKSPPRRIRNRKTKPKVSRRQEIRKITKNTRKKKEKINETIIWLFEKIQLINL